MRNTLITFRHKTKRVGFSTAILGIGDIAYESDAWHKYDFGQRYTEQIFLIGAIEDWNPETRNDKDIRWRMHRACLAVLKSVCSKLDAFKMPWRKIALLTFLYNRRVLSLGQFRSFGGLAVSEANCVLRIAGVQPRYNKNDVLDKMQLLVDLSGRHLAVDTVKNK